MFRLFMLLFLCAVHLIACGDGESYPPMITGYSRQGELETFNPKKRFSMQADFKLRTDFQTDYPGEGASVFTVSFEIISSIEATVIAPVFPAPMAKLTWSVEGNTYQRIISVRSGTSITGVGEHLTVEVWDDARLSTLGVPIPPAFHQPYEVCVSAAPGVRGPASVGPVIVPWVYSPTAAPVSQNYGVIELVPGGAPASAYIDMDEYPLCTSLFFTVGNNAYDAMLDNDIRIVGLAAAGTITTFLVDGKSAGIWIPLQTQTEVIGIEINPAAANARTISLFLGVDG